MARNNRDPSIDTIASQCIAVRLRMVNRVVTNIYDEALRPLGIKVSQMNVLVAAAKMKLARPAEICEALQLDGSTLSRNLERMKARGWLEVVPDPDGRAQPFRVTKLGRKVLEELLPAWELAQKKAGAVLGQDLTEALARAASRLNKPSRGSDRDPRPKTPTNPSDTKNRHSHALASAASLSARAAFEKVVVYTCNMKPTRRPS